MNNTKNKANSIETLRLKVENLLQNKLSISKLELSKIEISKQLHELKVHQIELEMKNEELLQAQSIAQNAIDLYELAPNGYFTLSKVGEILQVNQSGADLLIRDKSKLIGKKFDLFVTVETESVFINFLQIVFDNRTKETCEISIATSNNKFITVYLIGTLNKIKDQCLLTVMDVSEQKQSAEVLQNERKLYEDIVNNPLSGICRIRIFQREKWWRKSTIDLKKPTYHVELISDRMCEILGITRPDFEDNPALIADLIYSQDKSEFIQKNEEANTKIIPFKWEGRLVIQEKIIWIHLESIPRLIANGEVLWTGILYDITDQTLGLEALKESEKKYRELVDNSPDAIAIHAEGMIVFINNECLRLMNTSKPQDLLGKSVLEFIHPDYRLIAIERINKVIKEGVVMPLIEEKFIRLDGVAIDVEVKSIPILFENKPAVQIVIRNITEQKSAEKSLLQSEERFQQLFNNAPLGYQSLDFEGKFIEVNTQWLDILGYTREDVIGKWFGDFLSDDFKEGFRQRFPIFKAQGHIQSEFEMKRKNGTKLFIAFDGRIGYDVNGNFKQTHCILQDITQRKISDNELINSREDFKNLFDNAPVGYHEIDTEGRIVRMNQTELDMLGYSMEEMRNQYVWNNSENETESHKATKNKLAGQIIPSKPFGRHFRRKDGSTFPVSVQDKILRGKDENIIGIRSTIQDISLQIQAENELKKSQEDFKDLFDNAPIGYHEIDADGRIIRMNQTELNMLGYHKIDEVIGLYIWEISNNTSETQLEVKNKLCGRNVSLSSYETVLLHRNGLKYTILIQDKILRDNKGNITGIRSTIQDITERKQAEQALRESEELYRNLVLRIPDGVYKSSINGKFIDVNPAMVKLLGYASKEELMDIDIKTQLYFDISDREHTVLNDQKEELSIFKLKKKDGSIIWIEDNGWYNTDNSGNIETHEGVLRDITERKIAQDALQERESILKKTLIESSGLIDITSEGIEYEKISNIILEISGAKYVSFNLFDENGIDITTVAVSGVKENILKANAYFGFEVVNKKWKFDPFREEKTKDKAITRFESFEDLFGLSISKNVSTLVGKIFNLGEVFVVKISKNNITIGDFTLIYSKGEILKNYELLSLFANQVGLYLDREKTGSALRDSEEKYHYLFANNPQPMWIYDFETLYFLEVNQAAIEHYGYSKEEFLKMKIKDIRPIEDVPALLLDLQEDQKSYKVAGEWRHVKKNGKIINVDITTVSIRAYGKEVRHVLVQDITERKLAELALQEKMNELLRFHNLTVDRELSMIQLKKEINRMLVNSGLQEKYKIVK